MNKLVTKVVGIVFAIIVLIIILCFLIASCHRRRRSETLPQFHDQNEPAQRYQNFE
jgi:flagellar biosynthesis/type III secretory pathway M-ring protein FliF/YscJ